MNDLFNQEDINKDSTLQILNNIKFIDKQHQMEDVIRDIAPYPKLEFDTETTGLDPHSDKVIMAQIGTPTTQWVIDARKVHLGPLKPILEDDEHLIMGHNLAFDYMMMLGTFGITIERVYDSFLAEQVLEAGLRKFGFGLDDCVKRYFNHTLPKDMQLSFVNHYGDFTPNQIKYGGHDVGQIVTQIAHKQVERMRKYGLLGTAQIEFDVMQAFADMTYYGIPLNAQKWLSIGGGKTGEFSDVLDELNEYATKHHMVEIDMYDQVDMNWNSQQQVLSLLKQLWPNITSTGDDVLDTLYHNTKNELVGLLRKYRKLTKKTGTYGSAYVEAIHPKTGRLHPKIKQLGTDTGRPSSTKPNILNIPREKAYRVAFGYEPEEGRVIITIDYSGCELRIIADMSGDPFMCKSFNEGKCLHNFVTAMLTNTDYDAFAAKVKANDTAAKDLRQIYKGLNFGISYGLGAYKFANKAKISVAEAKAHIKAYKELFHVAMAWLDNTGNQALADGFATTLLGRKRFFKEPAFPPECRNRWAFYANAHTLPDGSFTGSYKSLYEFTEACKDKPNYLNYCREVGDDDRLGWHDWFETINPVWAKYLNQIGAMKRVGGNTPIQGGNADITKIAMAILRKRLIKGGYYPNARICLQVYDEIVVDAPASVGHEVRKIQEDVMIEAGQRVIRNIPVIVEGELTTHWTK